MTDTGPAPHSDDQPDIFGPLERSGAVRGWLLVAVVVVIGALLLPSATRPGLGTGSAAASSATLPLSNGTGSTPTVPPSSSTTSSTTTTAPITIAPSTIKVLVANGTNTNGAATTVASFLSGKGFSTLMSVNALTVVSASQVYAIGAAAAVAAREVADALGLPASSVQPASQPVPVASTGAATVVVIVGPDLTSRA